MEHFTRFPNKYIQENIKAVFGISRKFYITYILIDKYRSYENYSWITLRKILDFYGYKTNKRRPNAVQDILDVLTYMVEQKMIEVKQDINSLGYDTGIEIKIIPENFDVTNNFSRLTSSQLDFVLAHSSGVNREKVLMVFLYINSYIYTRPKDEHGNEILQNPESKPEAFWRSIEIMSKDLSMSKDTIIQCLRCLTSPLEGKEPLLIKKEVGSIQFDLSKPPRNVPNIYVLNKSGFEQEIEWATDRMLQAYNVASFDEMKGSKKN